MANLYDSLNTAKKQSCVQALCIKLVYDKFLTDSLFLVQAVTIGNWVNYKWWKGNLIKCA